MSFTSMVKALHIKQKKIGKNMWKAEHKPHSTLIGREKERLSSTEMMQKGGGGGCDIKWEDASN